MICSARPRAACEQARQHRDSLPRNAVRNERPRPACAPRRRRHHSPLVEKRRLSARLTTIV
ncbi:hypothetical protein GLE_0156 [Lysobacter enzymogenes]|uniref:Uncharacterized protein n=1 Tax=Lysobacter enzymogenes TaxID=69 RepID=A0A0S2DAD7_LYSEN|nr:hypothetical protein GLE_0156 [Lysobacter enzymogenes]